MSQKVTIQKGTADLTKGNLLKQIILFTLPIIATGVLQLLFNTADLAVVGQYASETALAAVGATGALTNLTVNLIMGLSVGAGVLVARYFGAKDDKSMFEVVHTALPTAFFGGLFFGVIGFIFAPIFLQWMGTPDDVIAQSTTYVRIIFCGVPFNVVYNFGASILRSVGNAKKPLLYLSVAGVINVLLNLFFVLVLKRDVDGVAMATIMAQLISAILVVRHLTKVDGPHKLYLNKFKIYPEQLKKIISIGLPAGIQGSLFSVSNILIQSSINSFGSAVMNGNAAAHNIEGYVFTSMNSLHQTALAFVGQHVGARKEKRILKICLTCLACVFVVGFVLGFGAYLLAEPLLTIYAQESTLQAVLHYGRIRLFIIGTTYFTYGMLDVMSGVLRGMGKSTQVMVLSLLWICAFRVLWIYTVFQANRTLEVLYYSYPISWIICLLFYVGYFAITYSKTRKRLKMEENIQQNTEQTTATQSE